MPRGWLVGFISAASSAGLLILAPAALAMDPWTCTPPASSYAAGSVAGISCTPWKASDSRSFKIELEQIGISRCWNVDELMGASGGYPETPFDIPITAAPGSYTSQGPFTSVWYSVPDCSGTPAVSLQLHVEGYADYATWPITITSAMPFDWSSTSSIDTFMAPLIPTSSWMFSTSTGNGSSTSGFGTALFAPFAAASTTFPGCVVSPLIAIFETLNAAANGSATPQVMTIWIQGSPLVLDLRGDGTTYPHWAEFVSRVNTWILGILWIVFGWIILKDLLKARRASDDE